ncbi:hypothetical protein PMIN01_10229 [Paraphaeosphaeria minitans]|uniref:Uncharacterized protein n=1 Tax=Paraphaeosphaeria minitans TaxID=565426 RepID=A0A9P6GC42_9PLEO|nr:hypothetical protein PMIN01_10229 [Paraphaeosphaeria minitans]
MQELKSQIKRLYDAVHKANKYMWLAMVRPGKHLTATPWYSGTGTIQEMQTKCTIHLQCMVRNSWCDWGD